MLLVESTNPYSDWLGADRELAIHYERDGEKWIQHKYGVVLAEGRTIAMTAGT